MRALPSRDAITAGRFRRCRSEKQRPETGSRRDGYLAAFQGRGGQHRLALGKLRVVYAYGMTRRRLGPTRCSSCAGETRASRCPAASPSGDARWPLPCCPFVISNAGGTTPMHYAGVGLPVEIWRSCWAPPVVAHVAVRGPPSRTRRRNSVLASGCCAAICIDSLLPSI